MERTLERELDSLIKEVSDTKFWETRHWNKNSYGAYIKMWAERIRKWKKED
jgi:hypothetical protein